MLHVYCPTATALLLLAARDDKQVLRFPVDAKTLGAGMLPGLVLNVKPLVPVNEQLLDLATVTLGRDVRSHVHIFQEFADALVLPSGETVTIYLALSEDPSGEHPADSAWKSMPELIRALPKNRSRLPYLRAWQILSGGLQLNTKAIEVDDVEKFFQD